MKKVLLVSGKLRSGKNQLSEYITELLEEKNLTVKQDLLARGVKDGCKNDFEKLSKQLNHKSDGIINQITSLKSTVHQLMQSYGIQNQFPIFDNLIQDVSEFKIKEENWYEDKTDLSRLILQAYGTDIFRNRIDKDWWIKEQKKRITESNEDVIIITDVRFPNEVDDMYSNDYMIIPIRIDRESDLDDATAWHESETALDNYNGFNYFVDNNGSLEDLKESAEKIVNEIISMQLV